jgi:hypothetical protein
VKRNINCAELKQLKNIKKRRIKLLELEVYSKVPLLDSGSFRSFLRLHFFRCEVLMTFCGRRVNAISAFPNGVIPNGWGIQF